MIATCIIAALGAAATISTWKQAGSATATATASGIWLTD